MEPDKRHSPLAPGNTEHQKASGRPELEPAPTLIVAEPEAGRHADRVVAPAGRRTLIESPFAVGVDPGALVVPRG